MSFKLSKSLNLANLNISAQMKLPRYDSLEQLGNDIKYQGDVILNTSTRELCYFDGGQWNCLDGEMGEVTLLSLGGTSIVSSGLGPDLELLGFESSDNSVNITPTATTLDLTISPFAFPVTNIISSDSSVKINVTGSVYDLSVSGGGSGSATSTNVGTGSEVYKTGTSGPFEFRTFVSPLNTVSITQTENTIELESVGGSGGSNTSLYTPQPTNRVHISQLSDATTNWEPEGALDDTGNVLFLHGLDETKFNRWLKMSVDDNTGIVLSSAVNNEYGNGYPGASEVINPQVYGAFNFNDFNIVSGGQLFLRARNGGSAFVNAGDTAFGSKPGIVEITGGDDTGDVGISGDVIIRSGLDNAGRKGSRIVLKGTPVSELEFWTRDGRAMLIDAVGKTSFSIGDVNLTDGVGLVVTAAGFIENLGNTILRNNLTVENGIIDFDFDTCNIGIDSNGNLELKRQAKIVVERPSDSAIFNIFTPLPYPPPEIMPLPNTFDGNTNYPSMRVQFSTDSTWFMNGRLQIQINNIYWDSNSMVFFNCYASDPSANYTIAVIRRERNFSGDGLVIFLENQTPADWDGPGTPGEVPPNTTFTLEWFTVGSRILGAVP